MIKNHNFDTYKIILKNECSKKLIDFCSELEYHFLLFHFKIEAFESDENYSLSRPWLDKGAFLYDPIRQYLRV